MSKHIFTDAELAELLSHYRLTDDPAAKAALVDYYTPLVKKIVSGFIHKKPNILDFEDLQSAGHMGLLDAISKFNDTKGASFKTYASIRIRGAILDEINGLDWTPRSVRQNIRGLIKNIDKHYSETGSEPSAKDLGEGAEEVANVTETMVQMGRTYMSNVEPEQLEFLSPTSDFVQDEISTSIKLVMEQELDEYEHAYITLKYYMGYSFKEIMKIMKLSSKEFTAIKDSAHQKLAEALADFYD